MLRYIVVIPVYYEPGITTTLESLYNCKRPSADVEIIIVVNSSEDAPQEIVAFNSNTVDILQAWIRAHHDDSMKFSVINVRLPAKDAGAGMARKVGMDEAVSRFKQAGNMGYIISFDADSTCDPDYFTAIDAAISKNPSIKGFNIYFEHPVSGNEFPEPVYKAIIQYELHLRYVNLFLKQTGFPFAFHTIGSCFGVRSDIYVAQGGMNRKKGGEDFYFLHKVIPLGNFEEINSTCVRPSPRESFRVPFGTGPVIRRFVATGIELTTYSPELFTDLKQFIEMIPEFYKSPSGTIKAQIDLLPEGIREFLNLNNVYSALEEINDNAGSSVTFRTRFYRWFNAFRIVKFMNFVSAGYYPRQPVTLAAEVLLRKMGYDVSENATTIELLTQMRKIERNNPN